MNKSESIKSLAEALSKVRFPQFTRDKKVKVTSKRTGATYEFMYAPLESIMSKIRTPLADQGLTLSQSVEFKDGRWVVETLLLHSSGEWRANSMPVVNPESASPQEFGSSVTYARRYGVTLCLCLVADEDDDANLAEGNVMQTKATKGVIKPTSGAGEGLTQEQVNKVNQAVKKVTDWLLADSVEDAVLEKWNANLDADESVFFWTFFDSKQRSAMTKEFERQKQKNLKNQEAQQA